MNLVSKSVYFYKRALKHLEEDSPREFFLRISKILYINTVKKGLKSIIYVFREHLIIDSPDDFPENFKTEILEDRMGNDEILKESPSTNNNWYKEFKAPYLARIDDCYSIGKHSTVFKRGKILPDTIAHSKDWKKRAATQVTRTLLQSPLKTLRLFIYREKAQADKHVEHAAVMNNITAKYFYHWNLEILPILRGIRKLEEKENNTTLIIPKNPPKFVKESLELLEPERTIIEQGKDQIIKIDNLLLPSYPQLTQKNLSWLRKTVLQEIDDGSENYDKLYISRQREGKRCVENFDEIKGVLSKSGVKIVKTENYSYEEQIKLTANSESIIGVHGAGLSHIVWSKDLNVLELTNRNINDIFWLISKQLKHNYYSLEGKTDNPSRDSNIFLEKEKLKKKLEELK